MDVETLVGALNADERDELLERLTAASENPDSAADDSEDGFWCCGGPRSSAQRREMMSDMRQMCGCC